MTAPYLVCATPRSGSTLLCEVRTDTGVAGRPQEFFERLYATGLPRQPREYFSSATNPTIVSLLAPVRRGFPESAESFEQRLQDALRDGRTPNGVWAAKLMWGYLLDFLRRLREREATAHLRAHDAINDLLPGVQYVHVRRREKLAQAISLWTAVQTGRWRQEKDEDDPDESVYSHGAIAHLLDQLIKQDRAWTRWFAAGGIQPRVVFFEELIEDRHGEVCGLLRDLHIDTHGVSVPEPDMRRQADERSLEWAQRFESERKAAVA